LDKASSDEIKKQLQEAIEYGNSHLKDTTLEEIILNKDLGFANQNYNKSNREDDSNSINNKSGRNQNGADREWSSSNNHHQQDNRFDSSTQLDLQNRDYFQQNRFQQNRDSRQQFAYQQDRQNTHQQSRIQFNDNGSGYQQQNRFQSRHDDQHNWDDYQHGRFHTPQAAYQNNSGYPQNRFQSRYEDQENGSQQNRFESRQHDQLDRRSYQQRIFQYGHQQVGQDLNQQNRSRFSDERKR
jgi:hypothetical protein